MLHRDSRKIVNTGDHLTTLASESSCSGRDLGARAARPQISIAPLVPMCQKEFGGMSVSDQMA